MKYQQVTIEKYYIKTALFLPQKFTIENYNPQLQLLGSLKSPYYQMKYYLPQVFQEITFEIHEF